MEKLSWKALSGFPEATCKSVKQSHSRITDFPCLCTTSLIPQIVFIMSDFQKMRSFLKQFADKTVSKNWIILKDSKLFLKLNTGHIPWILEAVLITLRVLSHFSHVRLLTMDCSPQGSSVPEILQARILEWVVIFFSRGNLPDPGIKPASLMSPALAGRFFTMSTTRQHAMLSP